MYRDFLIVGTYLILANKSARFFSYLSSLAISMMIISQQRKIYCTSLFLFLWQNSICAMHAAFDSRITKSVHLKNISREHSFIREKKLPFSFPYNRPYMCVPNTRICYMQILEHLVSSSFQVQRGADIENSISDSLRLAPSFHIRNYSLLFVGRCRVKSAAVGIRCGTIVAKIT